MPISTTANSRARGTLRFGSRVSSPSVPADSNPTNIRMPHSMPKPIPLTPVSQCAGLKGGMVFPLAPPLPMIVTNRLSSTPTSRVRKISAVFAELLMPREPMNQMIAMITALMTHQGLVAEPAHRREQHRPDGTVGQYQDPAGGEARALAEGVGVEGVGEAGRRQLAGERADRGRHDQADQPRQQNAEGE